MHDSRNGSQARLPEVSRAGDAQADPADWLRSALHDLAQPITALECGLYVGTMSPDGVRAPRAEELLQTILIALTHCERAAIGLREIMNRLNSAAGKTSIAA